MYTGQDSNFVPVFSSSKTSKNAILHDSGKHKSSVQQRLNFYFDSESLDTANIKWAKIILNWRSALK